MSLAERVRRFLALCEAAAEEGKVTLSLAAVRALLAEEEE